MKFGHFLRNGIWVQTKTAIHMLKSFYIITKIGKVYVQAEYGHRNPIFMSLYRNIGFFSVWYIFGQKRPPPVLKLIKSYFYLLIACFLVFLRIFRHFSWIKVAQLVKAVSTHFCPKMKFWPKWRITPEIEQKRGING